MNRTSTRRNFLKGTITSAAAAELGILIRPVRLSAAPAPRNDPASHLKLGWTGKLKSDNVVDITAIAGVDWADRLENAQRQLGTHGGGVVYFPPGKYVFADSVRLDDGIILRGGSPAGSNSAKESTYRLPTEFEFPRFVPSLSGDGTDIATAFKGIYLRNPATASN